MAKQVGVAVGNVRAFLNQRVTPGGVMGASPKALAVWLDAGNRPDIKAALVACGSDPTPQEVLARRRLIVASTTQPLLRPARR